MCNILTTGTSTQSVIISGFLPEILESSGAMQGYITHRLFNLFFCLIQIGLLHLIEELFLHNAIFHVVGIKGIDRPVVDRKLFSLEKVDGSLI